MPSGLCTANKNIRTGYLPSSNQLQGVSNPSQLAVDAHGTLYVANAQTDASGAGSIAIYPRGATSPTRTLTAGLNTTEGVAVDSAGTVYASNKYQASIVVFAKGKSAPQATIKKNLVGPDGLAVDKAGNLYIADSSANDVLKLSPKSKVPQSLHLKNFCGPTASRSTVKVTFTSAICLVRHRPWRVRARVDRTKDTVRRTRTEIRTARHGRRARDALGGATRRRFDRERAVVACANRRRGVVWIPARRRGFCRGANATAVEPVPQHRIRCRLPAGEIK